MNEREHSNRTWWSSMLPSTWGRTVFVVESCRLLSIGVFNVWIWSAFDICNVNFVCCPPEFVNGFWLNTSTCCWPCERIVFCCEFDVNRIDCCCCCCCGCCCCCRFDDCVVMALITNGCVVCLFVFNWMICCWPATGRILVDAAVVVDDDDDDVTDGDMNRTIVVGWFVDPRTTGVSCWSRTPAGITVSSCVCVDDAFDFWWNINGRTVFVDELLMNWILDVDVAGRTAEKKTTQPADRASRSACSNKILLGVEWWYCIVDGTVVGIVFWKINDVFVVLFEGDGDTLDNNWALTELADENWQTDSGSGTDFVDERFESTTASTTINNVSNMSDRGNAVRLPASDMADTDVFDVCCSTKHDEQTDRQRIRTTNLLRTSESMMRELNKRTMDHMHVCNDTSNSWPDCGLLEEKIDCNGKTEGAQAGTGGAAASDGSRIGSEVGGAVGIDIGVWLSIGGVGSIGVSKRWICKT
jgi:hypothetical protein